MKTEYLFKMFLEFSKAYGINDTFNNFERYQDLFARWVYEKEKASILGVQVVPDDDVSKYGIINPKVIIDDKMILADSVIEKPTIEEAPSRYAVLGRYVLTNKCDYVKD